MEIKYLVNTFNASNILMFQFETCMYVSQDIYIHKSKHRSYTDFNAVQALSFEVCECDSTPSHTLSGLEECNFQYTEIW